MLISETPRRLLRLLADGQFHSGTELADKLAISRSAVWKQLQTLAELNIELVAVSGKGYKLNRPIQLLDRERISSYLEPRALQLLSRIDIHDVIDSTNNHLLEAARNGDSSGLICVSEYQSGGKGRRGRGWVSPFGHNIYLSALWRYQCGPGSIAGLSLAIGVAVVKALIRLGVDDIGLKWPNDIYWRRRKLAGILIEVSGESGGPCHAVIGVGLNLYLPDRQAEAIEQAWADLRQIIGDSVFEQRNKLVALLLNELLPVIAEFDKQSLSEVAREWRHFDCMQGEAAAIYIGNQIYRGIVQGIDDQGMLLLDDSDGKRRSFASGEVSFRAT